MEKKRIRHLNFHVKEEKLLVDLISKYKHTLENKKRDAMHWSRKKLVWDSLTHEFNSQCLNIYRSTDQLKLKYNNLKKRVRKNPPPTAGNVLQGSNTPRAEAELIDKQVKELINSSQSGIPPTFDPDEVVIKIEESRGHDVIDEDPNTDDTLNDIKSNNSEASSDTEPNNDETSNDVESNCVGDVSILAPDPMCQVLIQDNSAATYQRSPRKLGKAALLRHRRSPNVYIRHSELVHQKILHYRREAELHRLRKDLLLQEREKNALRIQLLKLEIANARVNDEE